MSVRRALAIAATAVVVSATLAAPVFATFGGPNGRITFARFVPATNGL